MAEVATAVTRSRPTPAGRAARDRRPAGHPRASPPRRGRPRHPRWRPARPAPAPSVDVSSVGNRLVAISWPCIREEGGRADRTDPRCQPSDVGGGRVCGLRPAHGHIDQLLLCVHQIPCCAGHRQSGQRRRPVPACGSSGRRLRWWGRARAETPPGFDLRGPSRGAVERRLSRNRCEFVVDGLALGSGWWPVSRDLRDDPGRRSPARRVACPTPPGPSRWSMWITVIRRPRWRARRGGRDGLTVTCEVARQRPRAALWRPRATGSSARM